MVFDPPPSPSCPSSYNPKNHIHIAILVPHSLPIRGDVVYGCSPIGLKVLNSNPGTGYISGCGVVINCMITTNPWLKQIKHVFPNYSMYYIWASHSIIICINFEKYLPLNFCASIFEILTLPIW